MAAREDDLSERKDRHLSERFSRSLNPADKVDEIAAALGSRYAALLQAIVEAERTGAWRGSGLDDLDEWVAQRCDVTMYRARRFIAAGKALGHLPMTAEALRTGRLGIDKVVELTRFATPDKEARQIEWARRKPARDVRARGDEANAAPKEDVEVVDLSRHVSRRWSIDGLTMDLHATLPAFDGALVWDSLNEVAATLEPTPEDLTVAIDVEEDTLGQRLADALVMTIVGGCDEGGHSRTPTLVVHAELDVLKGEDLSGRLMDGPALHPAIVGQIACDSRLQTVLEKQGTAVAASSEAYSPPEWMRRQIDYRDRGCSFPGCHSKKFIQPHHVTPHPAGRTSIANLVGLCYRHHRLVHLYGWRVSLGSGPQDFAAIEWYRPDGRKFAPGPDPPL